MFVSLADELEAVCEEHTRTYAAGLSVRALNDRISDIRYRSDQALRKNTRGFLGNDAAIRLLRGEAE